MLIEVKMRNKIINILFIGMTLFFGCMQANPDGTFTPHHMKSEKTLRRELYRAYEANPYFYKMNSCDFFKDIDYYIQVLKDNLKKRQGKIAHGRTFFDSNSGKRALTCLFSAMPIFMLSILSIKEGLRTHSIHSIHSELGFLLFVAGWMGGWGSLMLAIGGVANLSKMNNYSQRKIDHLERAKRLVAIFEMEKRKQQEKELSGGKNEK